MTPTKWFLLLLLALALLAAVVLLGVQGDSREYSQDGFVARYGDDPPDWSRTLFSLAEPFIPRLELGQPRFQVRADEKSKPIFVPRSEQPFRRAAWALRAGSVAVVRYQADDTDFEELKEQELTLKRGMKPSALAILPAGGKIWIECRGISNCLVELVE